MAPVSALVAIAAYLARQPLVILGFGGCQVFLLSASSESESFTFKVLLGISISIMSPFLNNPIGPPTAASGLIWPIQAPLVPPLNLPSVISATDSPSPAPII